MVKRYWKETWQVPLAVGEHPDGDYVKFADYAALAAELAAHKRLNADLEASDVRLRARIRELEACVLEYWHAKDWDAVGAADATAAKLLPDVTHCSGEMKP